MKISTKPISSPGRTDKFPPPLMRFLRNNAASKSRGRSKSNTIFLRKKNTAIEPTQEPSSPKVTCMGQVRVKRSVAKKKRAAASSAGAASKCLCFRWVPLLFHRLIKPGSCHHFQCQPVWPNWGFLGRGRKASKVTEASPKTELNFRGRHSNESEQEEAEDEERVNACSFVSNSTPPKNALLLTRCRSAPYRSSSLASRFWSEETGVENREPCENERTHIDEDEVKDPKLELKLKFFKELEDSLRERIMESEKVLKRREETGDSAHPLVLTRCKSEPARTAQKLDPEVNNFWKKTRLGFAHAWYSHAL